MLVQVRKLLYRAQGWQVLHDGLWEEELFEAVEFYPKYDQINENKNS